MTRIEELTIAATGWEALAKSRAGDLTIQAATIATLQATIEDLVAQRTQLLEARGETEAKVASGNECPACDEAREDYLIWNDDDDMI